MKIGSTIKQEELMARQDLVGFGQEYDKILCVLLLLLLLY